MTPDPANIEPWLANLKPEDLIRIAQTASADQYLTTEQPLNRRIADLEYTRRHRPGQKLTQAMLTAELAKTTAAQN